MIVLSRFISKKSIEDSAIDPNLVKFLRCVNNIQVSVDFYCRKISLSATVEDKKIHLDQLYRKWLKIPNRYLSNSGVFHRENIQGYITRISYSNGNSRPTNPFAIEMGGYNGVDVELIIECPTNFP